MIDVKTTHFPLGVPLGSSTLAGRWAGTIAAWAVLVVGCGPAPEPTVKIANSLNPSASTRMTVATLSPGATRFVLGLGGRDLLVGVDPESSELPGTENLPTVNLESARQLAPRLIIGPKLASGVAPSDSPAPSQISEYVEYAPHNLTDVFELCRTLGRRLVGLAGAAQFEREIARPLALMTPTRFHQDRPRIAAVTNWAPLELAGGHSFATDLIEIAGGNSVTHGGEEYRLVPDSETWQRLAPELVLVLSREPLSSSQRENAHRILPPEYPILFFPFDPDRLLLPEFAAVAESLQAELRSQRSRGSSAWSVGDKR